MQKYVTIQGDMLDMICRRTYGEESGLVEQVYEANPGLASLDLVFPSGVEISLPAISTSSDLPEVSIWA